MHPAYISNIIPATTMSTDAGFTSPSDTLVPTTLAAKTYIDGKIAPSQAIKNYIVTNSDFETGATSPWTTSKDASGTTLTNGGIGTANVGFTLTAPSDTALFGTKLLLLTKAVTADSYGSTIYYDFSIDPGETINPLSIHFAYLTTGGYNNKLKVYLWDRTNNNSIPLSTNGVPTSSSVSNFYASFFPSSSVLYRLVIMDTVNTSTVAYTVKMDNFVVSKYTTPNAAAVGGWQSYTPSANITNLPGAWISSKWRRVGDSIDVQAKYVVSGAATGSIALLRAAMIPSGLTASPIQGHLYPVLATFATYQAPGIWDADTGGAFYTLPSPSPSGRPTSIWRRILRSMRRTRIQGQPPTRLHLYRVFRVRLESLAYPIQQLQYRSAFNTLEQFSQRIA